MATLFQLLGLLPYLYTIDTHEVAGDRHHMFRESDLAIFVACLNQAQADSLQKKDYRNISPLVLNLYLQNSILTIAIAALIQNFT